MPVVGVPGADVEASAGWLLVESAVEGAFHIVAEDGSDRALTTAAAPALAMTGAVRGRDDGWTRKPAEDGYQYIVAIREPECGLQVVPGEQPTDDLELVCAPVRLGDRSAMWRIDQECVADARSIHLRYEVPQEASLFYNEIYPRATPPGTYLCSSGFGAGPRNRSPAGYAGIQSRPDGSQRAIFSVWHRMADEVTPVANALATVVGHHPEAHATEFSGEGVGSSIRLPFPFDLEAPYPIRFAIAAEPLGADTLVAAFVASGSEPWISLGAIVRAGTRGELLAVGYSFVEDFKRSGNLQGIPADQRSPYQLRAAVFANPWVRTSRRGLLQPLIRAKITAYSPHPAENLLGRQVADRTDFGILLANGAPLADAPSPVGSTIADPTPQLRPAPLLGGVP